MGDGGVANENEAGSTAWEWGIHALWKGVGGALGNKKEGR